MSTTDSILTKYTNVQKAQASMHYRDALAQYLLVAKALRLLRNVENLEGTADRAMRAKFEARFQRLTDRLCRLATAIKGFRADPLTQLSEPKAAVRSVSIATSYGMPVDCGYAVDEPITHPGAGTAPMVNINGLPMVGSIDMQGNPYGVTSDYS